MARLSESGGRGHQRAAERWQHLLPVRAGSAPGRRPGLGEMPLWQPLCLALLPWPGRWLRALRRSCPSGAALAQRRLGQLPASPETRLGGLRAFIYFAY